MSTYVHVYIHVCVYIRMYTHTHTHTHTTPRAHPVWHAERGNYPTSRVESEDDIHEENEIIGCLGEDKHTSQYSSDR